GKILAYSVPSPGHVVTTRESGCLPRARPQSGCRWDGWRAGIVLKRDVPIPPTSLLALAGPPPGRPPSHNLVAPPGLCRGYLGDPKLRRRGRQHYRFEICSAGEQPWFLSPDP